MTDRASVAESVIISEGNRKDAEPGPDLYRAVLSAFVGRRQPPRSLNEWCNSQDPVVPRSTANGALVGVYDSEEARSLRERIMRAAGLLPAEEP